MSSPCLGCKYHETFVDDMGDYFEDDGCICHHDKADSKEYGDYHLNCCYEYGDKLDKCPYYEEDEKEEFEKCFSSEIPDEVIGAIKYLDDYELYSPFQEAWQIVKDYYGIITER